MNIDILKKALNESVQSNYEEGSCTITILCLHSDTEKKKSFLYYTFLGDSFFIIARQDKNGVFQIFFKSEEKPHKFNVPYQVGSQGDDPNEAKRGIIEIFENDYIILASDGLWDNVEDEIIMNDLNLFIKKSKTNIIEAKIFAEELGKKAEKNSLDKEYRSPFSIKAQSNKIKHLGGKPDDITIIVAQIINNEGGEETIQFNSSTASVSDFEEVQN